MEKSVFTRDYQTMLRHLRQTRKESGLTQTELGSRLGQTQTFVSKCERGERRLDAIELRAFCLAMDTSVIHFLQALETELAEAAS